MTPTLIIVNGKQIDLKDLIHRVDILEQCLRHTRTQLRRNKWSESSGGVISAINEALGDVYDSKTSH